MKQAGIYVNDIYCGILTEDEEGFHFVYDEAYLTRQDAAPVSPTMPLTDQQYDKEMMFPDLMDSFQKAGSWISHHRRGRLTHATECRS